MNRTLAFTLVVLLGFSLAVAQTTAPKPTITKFAEPVYPRLARTANIWGDVIVSVKVGIDGTSQAEIKQGPPMLSEAALQSAKETKFACNGCNVASIYVIVYKFVQTEAADCCTALSVPATVTIAAESSNDQGIPMTIVTVAGEHGCLCDPTFSVTRIRTRSAKCLYLWHCSTHTERNIAIPYPIRDCGLRDIHFNFQRLR